MPFHLNKQVIIGIKPQIVVKVLLITVVTAFHLTVVTRSARANEFVFYAVFKAELVKDMDSLCPAEIGELRAVIYLKLLWSISEIGNRPPAEIHC